MRDIAIYTLAVAVIAAGAVPAAWGSAQLDIYINPASPESIFTVTYQMTVIIFYEEGGNLAALLRGTDSSIELGAQDGDPGAEALKGKIEASMLASDSAARIGSLDVDYRATLEGRQSSATVSHTVRVNGTLQGHTIVPGSANQPAIVDMAWRDITVKDPVVLQGTEINLPTSAIETLAPGLTAALPGEALALLNRPLIVSTILYEYPLDRWHRIAFPPNSAEAKRFGLSGDISDSVVTTLTVDSSDRKLAPKMNRFEQAHFVLDRPYEVVTLYPEDVGSIKILGYAVYNRLGGVETVNVTAGAPGSPQINPEDSFPVMMIYGMAGLAAAAIALFMFSSRAPKKGKGMGRQGTYPSAPAAYQTDMTEARMGGAGDYARHRSARDGAPFPAPSEGTPSPKRAMPKDWKSD